MKYDKEKYLIDGILKNVLLIELVNDKMSKMAECQNAIMSKKTCSDPATIP